MELTWEEINSLLNAVHSIVPATSLKPLGDKPPVGYIRAKVYSRGVLLSALVDSGNLFAELEKMSPYCRLGLFKRIGHSLGQVKPFRIYLENMSSPFYIYPYVVKHFVYI